MADVLSHHGKATAVGFGNNGFADCGYTAARCETLDCQMQAIESTLRNGTRQLADRFNQKRLALVTKPSINHGGQVDIDDVALAKFVITGYSVADHIIDAGAATAAETLITERCGAMAMV